MRTAVGWCAGRWSRHTDAGCITGHTGLSGAQWAAWLFHAGPARRASGFLWSRSAFDLRWGAGGQRTLAAKAAGIHHHFGRWQYRYCAAQGHLRAEATARQKDPGTDFAAWRRQRAFKPLSGAQGRPVRKHRSRERCRNHLFHVS